MSNKREDNDKKLFDNIAYQYVKKDLTSYCRMSRKLRLIQSIKDIKQPIKNILEVGCGAGFAAEYLKGKFIKYTGIDYSENLIKYAIEHNNEIDVQFQCLNINQFETKNKFDVVLMIGVLHHMSNPENVIKSLSKLLKSDGIIVANEPQGENPLIGFLRKIRKKIDNNYSSDQVEFTESKIRSMFEKCGHEVKTYPQGIFSTPLAETRILPNFIGLPLAFIATTIDPLIEKILSILSINRLSWNMVVHAKQKIR